MRLLLLSAAVFATGCATTLSTFQTARPLEKGHLQLTGGMGIYAPLGPTVTVVGQAIKQGERITTAIANNEQVTLSEEDQQELLTAGIALAVMPPGQGQELSVRAGLAENFDMGFRYSVNALRLDAKYRVGHSGDEIPSASQYRLWGKLPEDAPKPEYKPDMRSMDIALGLAVSKYLFKNPVFDVLEFVQLGDFSRWDIEVPVYLSMTFGDIFSLYAAPKYIYSHTSLDEKLVNYSQQGSNITGLDLALPAEVHTHFIGATGGLALGYRYVHVMLELTSGYTICNPWVFGRQRSLGGVTLYPGVGVSLKY
jgi:hypothetical protein